MNGQPLWIRYYGIDSGREYGNGIAVDAAGENVYVTGYFNDSDSDMSSFRECLLLKYRTLDGTFLWDQTYDIGHFESGERVKVGSNGNIYISGILTNDAWDTENSARDNLLALKYDPAGSLLWDKRTDIGLPDVRSNLAVGALGNVYVTGVSSKDSLHYAAKIEYLDCDSRPESSCSDGIDNDGDGCADTHDTDCGGTGLNCSTSTAPGCTDEDRDKVAIEGGTCGAVDCDDKNPMAHPGALEICGNSVDEDCDGVAAKCTVHDVSIVSLQIPKKMRACSQRAKKIVAEVANPGEFTERVRVQLTADGKAMGERTIFLDPAFTGRVSFSLTPSSLTVGTRSLCMDAFIGGVDATPGDNTVCRPVTVVNCQE